MTFDVNSSTAVQYCGYRATLTPSGPTAFTDPCIPASNLNAPGALPTYNSQWPLQPHAGSVWLGPQADANFYRPLPGSYDFRMTFSIPAGSTSPLLNLSSLADNDAIVFLNGHEVGRNLPLQDCPLGGPCNWNVPLTMSDNVGSDFHVGHTDTLDVILIDVPIGFGPSGFVAAGTCASGPQTSSPLPDKLPIDGGTWSVADCRSPTGINFWGTVSHTPPVALFVVGDVESHAIDDVVNFWGAQWWKNNQMSGTVSDGVASFKGYATQSDNRCGGSWVSKPGDSSNPPDQIAADIAIIVTSKVIKNGDDIGGDIKQILIVHQDGGYGPNPGHRGSGPVTTILCSL